MRVTFVIVCTVYIVIGMISSCISRSAENNAELLHSWWKKWFRFYHKFGFACIFSVFIMNLVSLVFYASYIFGIANILNLQWSRRGLHAKIFRYQNICIDPASMTFRQSNVQVRSLFRFAWVKLTTSPKDKD